MKKLPRTRSCFVCGKDNASGLRLEFETDGSIVRARYVPAPEHVGFKGVIHGGIVATILDEIMVWACGVQTKRFAFCAELNVRYLRHVAPGMELWAEGKLTSNRRNRVYETEGILRDGDHSALATATGKYIPIKEGDDPKFLEEFEGGATTLEGLFQHSM